MSVVALHTVLREGRETDYDVVHERIPDDLMVAHRRAGIRDWRIWRSGRDCFHLVECDDFAAALELLEHDPANVRWQEFIGDYVDHLEPGAADDPTLPLVWRMRAQEEG
jgi:L-rhamnose mutarotase